MGRASSTVIRSRQKKPTDDPKTDLVSVRLDGTDKKRHLRLPAIGELVPSPDNRWVAFTSRDNVYVTPLPDVMTAEPPEVSLKDGAVPVWRLSSDAGNYVGWADGGKTITWGLARTFYRLPLDSAVAFAREQKRKAAEKAGRRARQARRRREAPRPRARRRTRTATS